MSDSIESLIRLVYKEWKDEESKKSKTKHPDAGLLAVLSENALLSRQDTGIKLHLILCDSCSETLAAQLLLEIDSTREIPCGLLKWAKALPIFRRNTAVLVRIFRLKKKIFAKMLSCKFISFILLRRRQLKNLLITYR